MSPVDPAAGQLALWHILDAIGRGEIHPHYQPIVSLRTGEVLGVEALARWIVPGQGTMPAALFVPVLERCHRVTDLTAFMLDRACSDLAFWQQRLSLRNGFRVTINVSATELGDRRLAPLVREALATHGIDPASLCLELTETAEIHDFELAATVLAELAREVGIRLAVDDFGTGFAAGGYLTSFPFDTVKIDQVFVAGMGHRADHADFIRATIGYAHGRSLGVVAEGIEHQEQAAALLSVGCTAGQGYALGMPCPSEDIVARGFTVRLDRPTASV
ncbi:MAG: EAL domain-containing protein [Acidimicrobiales bacterium]